MEEYNKKQSHGTPPNIPMHPISRELIRKFLADQPQSNKRGTKKNANETIDVIMKNIDNGFSRIGVVFDAPLVSAIEVRLKINGITAPTEHKFLGFANAGFNWSRSFKMSAHYNL